MYIFSYSHNFRQNSCGFNFVIKLKKFSTIFKITLLGWFFEKWSPTSPSSRVFLRPNFRVDFFLFRIIFEGISFVKLNVSSISWWTFFLVRLIFKLVFLSSLAHTNNITSYFLEIIVTGLNLLLIVNKGGMIKQTKNWRTHVLICNI